MLKLTPNAENRISVCFVCSGNTCRSPMAEAVLKHLAPDKFTVSSAGIYAFPGDPIMPHAVQALRSAGIPCTEGNDYEHHASTPLSEETVKANDLIICMTDSHAMALLSAFPEYSKKISVLGDGISDPFMQGAETYIYCLESITDAIKSRFGL